MKTKQIIRKTCGKNPKNMLYAMKLRAKRHHVYPDKNVMAVYADRDKAIKQAARTVLYNPTPQEWKEWLMWHKRGASRIKLPIQESDIEILEWHKIIDFFAYRVWIAYAPYAKKNSCMNILVDALMIDNLIEEDSIAAEDIFRHLVKRDFMSDYKAMRLIKKSERVFKWGAYRLANGAY